MYVHMWDDCCDVSFPLCVVEGQPVPSIPTQPSQTHIISITEGCQM